MRNSAVVFGASALFALMFVFAARTDVPQTVAATVSVGEDDQFEDIWREAAVNTALKSASLRVPNEPKVVQTEVVLPPIIATPEEITPKLKKKLILKQDICERHGMHKVQRGRSWRCRK
jgi:hypothetical protein